MMHQHASTSRAAFSTQPLRSARLAHPNLRRQHLVLTSTTCRAAAQSTTPAGVEYDFACPICFTGKLAITRYPNGTADAQLRCPCCQRTFARQGSFIDLTLTSGAPPRVYGQELSQPAVQLFRYDAQRSPVVTG